MWIFSLTLVAYFIDTASNILMSRMCDRWTQILIMRSLRRDKSRLFNPLPAVLRLKPGSSTLWEEGFTINEEEDQGKKNRKKNKLHNFARQHSDVLENLSPTLKEVPGEIDPNQQDEMESKLLEKKKKSFLRREQL
ncbi:Uncharacterized protein Rs2_04427 [Raphanus sativus]|nr:Uncharacterized protein Rs2_04427 [Raphanus sativus]